ncbi:2-C-methyl-D-erythritol 4-phosphate cytidylyltransferase [Herbaspirillum sp. CF444]|uniref:2-C-methyl-D-erythritol 4-phosphate cytidylyltransferase n=1 Tax=Herbaspirillum sp. CF444 TaxID=1144319 RepID=UPI0002724BB9|nr:2-C-methyl-D-erythritol 4-phosphate cytidylyltransferase [Herbaspirillum sp. CF444]EJL89874.1 2-C-methyl-D-erythritol 4-phosphate cytidylyltransferase [Herbaspirillum sp. CF444]
MSVPLSQNTARPARHFALIPAAGVGARLGGAIPKQYMPLAGKPMLQYALDTFAGNASVAHTFVVVSAADGYIDDFLAAQPQLAGKLTVVRHGGETRQESVRNGLLAIRAQVGDDDWILVHDAARPGLNDALLDKLIAALHDDDVGGLLALPIVDTLKRGKASRVQETVPRNDLWAAQTPQMFRYALLQRALDEAQEQGRVGDITDDASAVEMLGLQPKLVEGSPRNVKVTLAHDVALAELFLRGQE